MESLHLLQARYWDSTKSLETAKSIISIKCKQMRVLLIRALEYRIQEYPEQAHIIKTSCRRIETCNNVLKKCNDRQSILLTEARASRAYWNAFRLLTRCPPMWIRKYPKSLDPWNLALNVGYHFLSEIIRHRIVGLGLDPTIGILHAPTKGTEPLVYDFEELFRQPIIDTSIHRLAARGDAHKKLRPQIVVSMIKQRLQEKVRHHRKYTLDESITIELKTYRSCLEQNKTYLPAYT